MVTLNEEQRSQHLHDWLLGKRVYVQFSGAGSEHGAKMGGVAAALDDQFLVLHDEDRIYFVPWSSVRWVHPIVSSAEEREELASWMRG